MATLGFMMEDATMTAEQASDVNIIYLSASHMQRLVNDVLDLAKLREGTLKICPELVRLRLLTALISYPPANQRIIDELTSYDHIDALPAFLL
jgi:signal transduction histidine kinase